MNPTVYCHLEVRGTSVQGHGTMIVPVLAGLMTVLHKFFSDHPGSCALDFPEMKPGSSSKSALLGHMIRVFADSRERCEELMDVIEQHPVLRDAIMMGRIRLVPADYSGRWVSMHRARIAPRSQPNNRRRDLDIQRVRQAPFMMMRSQSTKQHFSLMLERRTYKSRDTENGVLNSYGLSGNRAFYLPDLAL